MAKDEEGCAKFMFNLFIGYQYGAHLLLFRWGVTMYIAANYCLFLTNNFYLYFQGPVDIHIIDYLKKSKFDNLT